jgi:hypothetical protein
MLKFVAHSGRVLRIARKFRRLPGARYTNLRDVREFERIGFLYIEWKDYCFKSKLPGLWSLSLSTSTIRGLFQESSICTASV